MSASKLVRPSTEFKDSYLEAIKEYHKEGNWSYRDIKKTAENFEEFVNTLRDEKATPHKPCQDWIEPVPETIVWLVKDTEYLGSLTIRHRLNWHLEKVGGHIKFIIRPSMRQKGFGKKILKKGIPIINYLGIDNALLTIAPDNEPAIKIAEYCGAEYQDTTQKTDQFPPRKRYWLDCT